MHVPYHFQRIDFFFPVDSGRKLTLLYVANDVIQNSKKKGPEYRTEFVKVLPRVFQGIKKLGSMEPLHYGRHGTTRLKRCPLIFQRLFCMLLYVAGTTGNVLAD